MNRYERRKHAIDQQIREHIGKYKAIYKKAEDDERDPSDEERLEIESELKAIETLKEEREQVEANIKTLEGVDDTLRGLGPAVPSSADARVMSEPHDRMFQSLAGAAGVKTLGQQFTESKGYQEAVRRYREAGGRFESNFSTGAVSLETKGTLAELPGSGGGGMIPVPQVIPGVVEKLFQPLTIEDLLLSGQASSNSLRYIVEGTATSGAAGVAEAGTKPESTAGFTVTDEPIKKIATVLPVSDEMLEDAPAIQAYINGRLSLFVQIEAERQLLRGAAGGNEVQGILTSRNVPVYAGGTAAGNYAEQLFKAMNGMRGSAFVEPDFIVMHPTDWQVLRLLKDTANQFYGGGPFLGPYGGPQGPSPQSGQVSGPTDTVWNKPVYITAQIGGAGTALIGSRASAQVWNRGGVTVEATNSHSTFFVLNLVAIRAERRLGLALYRPGGFVEARLA